MLATWITRQLVFDGVVTGLLYALLAMGIVLIYRATRVINFAVGAMGLVGGALFALLVVEWNVPFWIGAIVALGVGVLYGAILELLIIRRLFAAPRVIVLVATVGIAQLSQLIVLAYPEFSRSGELFPRPIGTTYEGFLGLRIQGPQLTILIVAPIVSIAVGLFLTRTTLGKTVKASSSNRDLARLVGISPKLVSTFVWALGGALATVAMCLMAMQTNARVGGLALLGPSTLVRALVAAVVAKLTSFQRAFVAAVVIGVVETVLRFNYLDQPGLMDFLLLIVVLVAVFFQSRTREPGETQTFSFAPRVKPVPERLRSIWWVRQLDRAPLVLIVLGAVLIPLIITQPSRHLLYGTILAYAIIATSLNILTGWAGQLSLGQMAFAGIGAFLAAAFSRGINWDIKIGDTRLYKAGFEGMPFGLSIVLAALVTAAVATIIGVGALRVRGLLLAVVTFAFAHASTQYLFRQRILTGGLTSRIPFPRTGVFGIDLSSQRSIYYLCLAVLSLVLVMVGWLRRTAVGWSTIAVRDNPDTASAYTVRPPIVKLRIFALAGGMAGLGGALLASVTEGFPVPVARYFELDDSLILLSIVVIGGLGSTAGPVLGALWVVGLPAFFPNNPVAPLLTSSVGMLILLMYFPGGLVQVGYAARDSLLGWLDRRMDQAPVKTRHVVPMSLAIDREARAAGAGPALRTEALTVRYGGRLAVDAVSLEVGRGEIVGLIGTNGAGKSSLMNAIGGFVSADGEVQLLGANVSGKSPAGRARLGLGRTFQAATLFPELTVRETVEVAMEGRGRSGMVATALAWPPTLKRQRRHRVAASELVDFLGLGRYADHYIADLSTGTRRIVELAALLALEAQVLCLDEPTAGVAQKETEAFGPLITEIRKELAASMLIIEHDMPLIMGISDRVYCLEAGAVIAEGDPVTVRNDPKVIASYLGTDERAIARSGAVAVLDADA